MNAHENGAPGRSCPLHFRYRPSGFATEARSDWRDSQVLDVVGGLNGNELALHETLRLFDAETGTQRLLFNGDFHWFDADPAQFARVQRERARGWFDAANVNVFACMHTCLPAFQALRADLPKPTRPKCSGASWRGGRRAATPISRTSTESCTDLTTASRRRCPRAEAIEVVVQARFKPDSSRSATA